MFTLAIDKGARVGFPVVLSAVFMSSSFRVHQRTRIKFTANGLLSVQLDVLVRGHR